MRSFAKVHWKDSECKSNQMLIARLKKITFCQPSTLKGIHWNSSVHVPQPLLSTPPCAPQPLIPFKWRNMFPILLYVKLHVHDEKNDLPCNLIHTIYYIQILSIQWKFINKLKMEYTWNGTLLPTPITSVKGSLGHKYLSPFGSNTIIIVIRHRCGNPGILWRKYRITRGTAA